MRNIIKLSLLCAFVFILFNCKSDDPDDPKPPTPKKGKENPPTPSPPPTPEKPKEWTVAGSMPDGTAESYTSMKELRNVHVVNKDVMYCAYEADYSGDDKYPVYHSNDGGVTWTKLTGETTFKAPIIGNTSGVAWNNGGFLNSLNTGEVLTNPYDADPTIAKYGKIAKRSVLAHIDDAGEKGIFIGGDKSVHELTVDVANKKVTNASLLYGTYDDTYNSSSATSFMSAYFTVDKENMWGGGYENNQPLLVFKTSGNWKEATFTVNGKTEAQITKLAFADDKNGYATVSDLPLYGSYSFSWNLLYKTSDGGENWSKVDAFTNETDEIKSIAVESDSIAYYVAGGKLYRTEDAGVTWSEFYTEKTVEKVAFVNDVLFAFTKTEVLSYK